MTDLQILGIKLNMSQVFKEDGTVVPVTIIRINNSKIEGDIKDKEVSVVGTSKGKGFAGGMKRWGFKHQHATRGSSSKVRAPGSIGCQTPGHVFKGKRMPGHLGNARVTISGLKIVDYIKNDGLIMVSGSVPGARNSSVVLKVHGE
jgi:50S ribosomal protein uL3